MCVLLLGGCSVAGNGGRGHDAQPQPRNTTPTVRLGGTVAELAVSGTLQERDGKAYATGRLLRGDGSPAAGVFVALSEPSAGIVGGFAGALGAFFGAGCGDGAVSCGVSGSAGRTKKDGTYSLRLDTLADGYTIFARASRDRHDVGAYVEAHLPPPTTPDGTPVPPLRFWEPGIRSHLDDDRIVVDFDPLADDGYGDLDFITLDVMPRELSASTQALHSRSVVVPGYAFDRAYVEDVPASLWLSARSTARVAGVDVGISYSSATVPLDVPPTVAASRGSPCHYGSPSGPAVEPCTYTDGDFDADPRPAADERDQPVVIDMGRVVTSRAVLVHGCFISCTLATSSDGSTWRREELDPDNAETAAWTDAGTFRYVRIDGADAAHNVRELSVWS